MVALGLACTGAASGLSAPRGLASASTVAVRAPGALAASPALVWVVKPMVAEALASAELRPRVAGVASRASLLTLSPREITARLAAEPESLGPMSVGSPNRGALFNAEQVPESPLWRIVEPDRAWGAPEAIASLQAAIDRVHAAYPDSPQLYVGQLSARHGGYLRPHRSHQSGRDADVGYFYLGGPGWYARAGAKNLDRARTWALVKAFASDPNVEAIFMDRSVQRLLSEHAEAAGESRAWLTELFEGSHRGGDHLIRHEWGHLTHLHVRFRCPSAQSAGERARGALVAARLIPDRRYY